MDISCLKIFRKQYFPSNSTIFCLKIFSKKIYFFFLEKMQANIPNILISSEDREPQISKNTKISQCHSPSRQSLNQHQLHKDNHHHQSQQSLNQFQGYDANSLVSLKGSHNLKINIFIPLQRINNIDMYLSCRLRTHFVLSKNKKIYT